MVVLKIRWKIVEWLTIKATNMSNLLLKKRQWCYTIIDLKQMPKQSLGNNLYEYLKKENLSYKPNLIRHDIKHILLNYKMKMPDELKIHAFLIGNKSYNLMGFIYLITCICIVPEIIPELIKEYKKGKNVICLKHTCLKSLITMDTKLVRQKLNILKF